ncbi:MAG TPA: hypothetical protein EYP33_06235 [Pyrodictium sp.]|nr:hypothetical protein [Pyrodictium sp.]
MKEYLLKAFTLSYTPISLPETSGYKIGSIMSLLYTVIIVAISVGLPIILFFGTLKKRYVLSKLLNVDYYLFYLYMIPFIGSLVRFLTYFAKYLTLTKYGLTNPEIITLFLVISTTIIYQKFKRVGAIILIMLLVSSMLILGKSFLYAYYISNPPSPYYYGPKEEGIRAFGFLVYSIDSTSTIGGSIQITSGLYEYISYYPLKESEKIIPVIIQGYIVPSPYTINDITTVYYLMNKELDYFIITNKELNYGLNGGLTVYLNPEKVNKLYKLMSINKNKIYSGSATIYHFRS